MDEETITQGVSAKQVTREKSCLHLLMTAWEIEETEHHKRLLDLLQQKNAREYVAASNEARLFKRFMTHHHANQLEDDFDFDVGTYKEELQAFINHNFHDPNQLITKDKYSMDPFVNDAESDDNDKDWDEPISEVSSDRSGVKAFPALSKYASQEDIKGKVEVKGKNPCGNTASAQIGLAMEHLVAPSRLAMQPPAMPPRTTKAGAICQSLQQGLPYMYDMTQQIPTQSTTCVQTPMLNVEGVHQAVKSYRSGLRMWPGYSDTLSDSQRLRIDPVRQAIQLWNSAHASGWAKCRCHSMNGTIVMGHKYQKRAQVSLPVIPGPITILGRVRIGSVHKHPEGPNWSSHSICGSVQLVRFRPSAPISKRPELAQHMHIPTDWASQGGPQYAGKSGGPTMKEFPVVMGVMDGPSKFFRPTGYAYDPAWRGNV
ncbi:uncharacterized protein F5891DRAFT_978421 [Suillus fuscotomentosus]|uniref:Uncharacterized protein n=1 Tax=Suillus fuscotomentosus TaxID=1912939 RepID=A0AAD4EB31_9AGAM|nr:uncharacterized protein F5891DRAFT_978421 [Suillus fuscotomentosus]KAG1902979.1 hypothetical protein F5891DRAFT_978421 [Suillus fuscotomentosus]